MFEKILKKKAIKVMFVLPRTNSAAEVLQTCSRQKFIRDVNNTVALLCSSPLSFRRHCFHRLRRLVSLTPYRLPQSPSVLYMIINLSNLNSMYVFNWSLLQIGFSANEIQMSCFKCNQHEFHCKLMCVESLTFFDTARSS